MQDSEFFGQADGTASITVAYLSGYVRVVRPDPSRSQTVRRLVVRTGRNRVNSVLHVKLWGLVDSEPARALTLLREQRNFHGGKPCQYNKLLGLHFLGIEVERLPYRLLIRYLALRRGIRGEEDWIAWIDECNSLIGRLPSNDDAV